VAEGLVSLPLESPAHIVIEHPVGNIEVIVNFQREAGGFALRSGGLVRTARKLAAGEVYIPGHLWE